MGIETLLGLLLASPRNVAGASVRKYWAILQRWDGSRWVTHYAGPASGGDAGKFLNDAPLAPPYLAETWYVNENNRWRKQGTSTNFGG